MSEAIAADTKSKSTEKKETKKKATTTKESSTTKSGSTKPVNINKADMKELTTLDGIGEARAKDIIAYRKKNGSFKKSEDLMNVNGIGPKIYEKNKKRIKLK